MKKGSRILALVMAVVMLTSVFGPQASAYLGTVKDASGNIQVFGQNDYLKYKFYPRTNLDNIEKYEFTTDQAAGYLLDLLDGVLRDANVALQLDEDFTVGQIHLVLDFGSVDKALYMLKCVAALVGGSDDEIDTVVDQLFTGKLLGMSIRSLVASIISDAKFGTLGELTGSSILGSVDALAAGRGVPSTRPTYVLDGGTRSFNVHATDDYTVLTEVLGFLADNIVPISKILTGQLDRGSGLLSLKTILSLLEDTEIENITIGELLDNPTPSLKKLLYPLLWDSSASDVPNSSWTYDKGIQDIVNWLLIDGTGYTAADGGTSVLGEGTEGLLPSVLGKHADKYESSTYYAYTASDTIAKVFTKGQPTMFWQNSGATDGRPVEWYSAGYYWLNTGNNTIADSAAGRSGYTVYSNGSELTDGEGRAVTFESGKYRDDIAAGANQSAGYVYDNNGASCVTKGSGNYNFIRLVKDSAGNTITDGTNSLVYVKDHERLKDAPSGFTSLTGDNYYFHTKADTDNNPSTALADVIYKNRTNGGASITNETIVADRNNGRGYVEYPMSFYQLINNALNGALNGLVVDLLAGLLEDMDKSELEMYVPIVTGLLGGFLDEEDKIYYSDGQNGKTLSSAEYMNESFTWLFKGLDGNKSGLSAFIDISYNGIAITDSFMSLLNKALRMAKMLIELIGIELPDTLSGIVDKVSTQAEPVEIDGVETKLYSSGETYLDVNGTKCEYDLYKVGDTDTYKFYFSDETLANVPSGATKEGTNVQLSTLNGHLVDTANTDSPYYLNPKLITDKYLIPNSNLYGLVMSAVLSMFIEDCYIPEYANTIASAGAYGLAAIAAQYMPELDFYERLDAYYYRTIKGQSYSNNYPQAAVGKELPWTEEIKLGSSANAETITIPRAAMDIGAAIGAYFLNAVFDVTKVISYGTYNGFTLEGTTFEQFLSEFFLWGVKSYLPALTGSFNAGQFTSDTYGGMASPFTSTLNTFLNSCFTITNGVVRGYKLSGATSQERANAVYALIDNVLFKLVPSSWLPSILTNNNINSTASTLFNKWFLNSVMNLDLQQIISLLQINTDPNAEMSKSVTYVLLNLVHRVLATLFGAHNVLPAAGANPNTPVHVDAYSVPTSITSFEQLLMSNGTNLAALLINLVKLLNHYARPLVETIMPFVMSVDTIKSHDYYEGDNGSFVRTNRLQSAYSADSFTIGKLTDYIEYFNADDTMESTAGTKLYFLNADKTLAEYYAGEILGDSTAIGSEMKDGSMQWTITLPDKFPDLVHAQALQTYFEEVENRTSDYVRTGNALEGTLGYEVFVDLDYIDATSECTIHYFDAEDNEVPSTSDNISYRTYDFSGFTTAKPLPSTKGEYGENYYEEGYLTWGREDYDSNRLFYYNRTINAVEDAQSFESDYIDFYEKDLPAAYGEWMDYYVRLQLKMANLYDTNGDNIIDNNDKNYPGIPDSYYPFAASSGSTNYDDFLNRDYDYIKGPYSFSVFSNTGATGFDTVKKAVAFGNENSVVLSNSQAIDVVRLATGDVKFDLNKVGTGLYGWEGLTAAQKNSITTLCNQLGYTYDAEANTISRKAFAFIPNSLRSSGNIGTVEGAAVSLTPIANHIIKQDLTDAEELQNAIQEGYTSFARRVKELHEGIYDHYDNLTWRDSYAIEFISSGSKLQTLKFFTEYTKKAYYPSGIEEAAFANRIQKNENGETRLVPYYTSESFDNFQRAYDYAIDLIRGVEAGNLYVTQSLITKAYKNVYRTYAKLVLRDSDADWYLFDIIKDTIKSILDGPFGTSYQGTEGYTAESLQNLINAYDGAVAFRNSGMDWDASKDKEINRERLVLEAVLDSLQWAISEVKIDFTPEYNALPDTAKTLSITKQPDSATDSIKRAYITGLQEGIGLKYYLDDQGQPMDYVNGVFNLYGVAPNSQMAEPFTEVINNGAGTGATLVGKAGETDFKAIYTAILFGDLNQDARIDGQDKTVLEYQKAVNSSEENWGISDANFYAAAGASGSDMVVNERDIAAIHNHYNRIQTISQDTVISLEQN